MKKGREKSDLFISEKRDLHLFYTEDFDYIRSITFRHCTNNLMNVNGISLDFMFLWIQDYRRTKITVQQKNIQIYDEERSNVITGLRQHLSN